jgi:alpha-methylacyl-CoA racemase
MASMAGHDMNYISIAGVLGAIGRPDERPQPPLNLIGDFGGGGLMLAFGIVCGVLEARTSGQGQVIDAAMVDGSAVLTTFLHGFKAMGIWSDERGANMLDSGAHYYEVYECADGRHVAIAAIEPRFWSVLCDVLGDAIEFPDGASTWTSPERIERTDVLLRLLTAAFGSRTSHDWLQLIADAGVPIDPVLDAHDVVSGLGADIDEWRRRAVPLHLVLDEGFKPRPAGSMP